MTSEMTIEQIIEYAKLFPWVPPLIPICICGGDEPALELAEQLYIREKIKDRRL